MKPTETRPTYASQSDLKFQGLHKPIEATGFVDPTQVWSKISQETKEAKSCPRFLSFIISC